MNTPARAMPTVMIEPWTKMKVLTDPGLMLAAAPPPEVKPPMAMMNGTAP